MPQKDNSLLTEKLKDTESKKKKKSLVSKTRNAKITLPPFIKYNNNKESIILLVKRHFLRE